MASIALSPAQGGSAGALEPPSLFPWAEKAQEKELLELLAMLGSSPIVPAWAHLKHFDLSGKSKNNSD